MVTSRIVLRRQGEVVVEVYPLAGPDEEDVITLDMLAQTPSTSLFVERAGAARTGWTPVESDVEDIVRLCRELDGLPLAIELAAARMRAMTVSELRARLSDRFRLLIGRNADLPERQRTLRAALDWSYELLSPVERATLAQVGVFRGGFDLDAAEAVCDAGDVWEVIPALQDHSFLISRERRGLMRYDLLEAVREYALERLGSAAEPLRRRHAGHYLPLAECAAAARDTADEPRLFARIENDLENMREAMEWGKAVGDAETIARLTTAMAEFMRRRGWGAERLERIETALNLAQSAFPDRAIVAWLQYHRANALRDVGRMPEAESQALQTLDRAREIGDERLQVVILNLLGVIVGQRKEPDIVQGYAEETAELAENSKDPYVIASALTNLANLHDELGNGDAALIDYERTLALWKQVGSIRGRATALCNMGVILNDQKGEHDKAIQLYAEALGLQMQLVNIPAIALLLANIAEASEGLNDNETALPLYVAAESLLVQARSPLARFAAIGRERTVGSLDPDIAHRLVQTAGDREPLDLARDTLNRLCP